MFLLLACSTASQVADRVADPDKIIHDYEWFHSAKGRVDSRAAQVRSTHVLLDSIDIAPDEKARLRIDLSGQQQSCRELVADYNANAQKVTVGVWKGWSLPEALDPQVCE